MTKRGSELGWRAGIFAAGLVIAALSFLDLCDLIFACGCEAAWRGAATQCNIHHATGPHCPWCSYGLLGGAIPFGLVVAGQALAAFAGRPRPVARLLLVLAAIPVLGGLAGLGFGLVAGYW